MNISNIENINESLSTHYLIYKIINNLNGKYYIGQHKTNDPYDDYMGSGTYLDSAKTKYGLSSFSKSILFDLSSFEQMNNKEAELVQLSNCYPYDQMSYNLIPGGSGWHLTPELCKLRGKKFSENYWNKSEADRLAYKNECKQRALMREANKTNEEREQMKAAIRQNWKNKTPNEIQQIVDKWKTKVYAHTKQQKDEITRKRLKSLKNRSEIEKQKTRLKYQNTLKNRSIERKLEIGKHHSEGLKEHYKKHPEQAKAHSKRMQGKGNPAFGRKWMNNGTDRVYVKNTEFQYYLANGYVFGWIKIAK